MHNTCEDSLLAAPLILDLALLADVTSRIEYQTGGMRGGARWSSLHPIMSVLSYLIKAPLMPPGAPVVNALAKQRACIENLFRACVGLPPDSHMALEHKRGMGERAAAAGATESGNSSPSTVATSSIAGEPAHKKSKRSD